METEYVLVDEERKELYDLGKGGWGFVFMDLIHKGVLMSLPKIDEMVRLFVDFTHCDYSVDWYGRMIDIEKWCEERTSPIYFMTIEQFGDTHPPMPKTMGFEYWTCGYKVSGSRFKDNK